MAKETAKAGRIITVDFTGVESGTMFSRVPEGDYGMKIAAIKHKKGEESGKPNLLFTFKLESGPKKGVGKSLGHNCSLQKQALWNLHNLLEACGKQVPTKAVRINIDNLIGLTCAASIIDEEYNGKKRSVVGSFFPIGDLGKTSEDGEELEEGVETAGEEETETAGEEEELFN